MSKTTNRLSPEVRALSGISSCETDLIGWDKELRSSSCFAFTTIMVDAVATISSMALTPSTDTRQPVRQTYALLIMRFQALMRY